MLEVIAESDHRSRGTVGRRTRQIALTSEREVVEIGSWLIAGLKRPSTRNRSGITGEDWVTDIGVGSAR